MQYDCSSVASMGVPDISDPTSLVYGIHIHHLTIQPVITTTMDLYQTETVIQQLITISSHVHF